MVPGMPFRNSRPARDLSRMRILRQSAHRLHITVVAIERYIAEILPRWITTARYAAV